MTDSKNGFRMSAMPDNMYNMLYNNNTFGYITPNEYVEGEWVFTADWNGGKWTAKTLSEAKKIAKRELKAAFKKRKIK